MNPDEAPPQEKAMEIAAGIDAKGLARDTPLRASGGRGGPARTVSVDGGYCKTGGPFADAEPFGRMRARTAIPIAQRREDRTHGHDDEKAADRTHQ